MQNHPGLNWDDLGQKQEGKCNYEIIDPKHCAQAGLWKFLEKRIMVFDDALYVGAEIGLWWEEGGREGEKGKGRRERINMRDGPQIFNLDNKTSCIK